MKLVRFSTVLLLAALASACASSPAEQEVNAEMASYVLPSVPSDVPNRTFVDFSGFVQLVGYEITADKPARPGSGVKLKLYWHSVKKLSPGWSLFTHVITSPRKKPYGFDDVGPLRALVEDPTFGKRQKLGPSEWIPGSVYVDEQEFALPEDISESELTIAVGLFRGAVQASGNEVEGLSGLRLPIVSGLSDGKERALLGRLATGVVPGEEKPKKKRVARPAGGNMPPGGRPRTRPPGRPATSPLAPAPALQEVPQ
jgi:hypothetical protein